MVGVGRIRGGPKSVIVIGDGIVGLSTAWFVQRRGAEVTVLDGAGVDGLTTGGQPQLLAMFDPVRRSTRCAVRPGAPFDPVRRKNDRRPDRLTSLRPAKPLPARA